MNQPYQKYLHFKCEMNRFHGNQPISHICADKNCKSSIESYITPNEKQSSFDVQKLSSKLQSSNSFLLCSECIAKNHQNHYIIPTQQFIQQAKTSSTTNIYDRYKTSPNYQIFQQKKNIILESLAKLTQKITNFVSYIQVKELSESENKVLNQHLISQNLQQQEKIIYHQQQIQYITYLKYIKILRLGNDFTQNKKLYFFKEFFLWTFCKLIKVIMQRIFTLEGNSYSNQNEFLILLKEIQDGLNRNKGVVEQYDQFKKEEDISLKEIDLIHFKLTQEILRMMTFFEKDLTLNVNVIRVKQNERYDQYQKFIHFDENLRNYLIQK